VGGWVGVGLVECVLALLNRDLVVSLVVRRAIDVLIFFVVLGAESGSPDVLLVVCVECLCGSLSVLPSHR